MTQVDFYVLKESSDAARLKLACRLIEQSFLAGKRVLTLSDTAEEQASFDTLLWTFGERSFVPHELSGDAGSDSQAPVLLATAAALPAGEPPFDVLVNLCGTAVPEAVRAARIIEVIDGEAARRQLGRERFRVYRDRGLSPAHHNLESDSQIGNG